MSNLLLMKRTVKTQCKVSWYKNWKGKRLFYLFLLSSSLLFYLLFKLYHFSLQSYVEELPFVKLILPQNIYISPSLNRQSSTKQKAGIYSYIQ